MKRIISKVAVLGSGVMGSRIACHFANTGIPVLLLDIAPSQLTDDENRKGLSLKDATVRNRIVNQSFKQTLTSKPASLYMPDLKDLIQCGNFEDNMSDLAHCDWIIEAVVEKLDIKQSLYEQIEQFRKKGSIISSNTSGIPIGLLTHNRSDDFKRHFLGTHFFNPVRYLPLLEIIPGKETDALLVEFVQDFGARFLGKECVICNDSPAFIANRIGVYSIMNVFHYIQNTSLNIEDIDALTGTLIGRPKSATFRTCDVVGLDTLIYVAEGLRQNATTDERKHEFELPNYIQQMKNQQLFGDKSGKGFYFKTKNSEGKKSILALNIKTLKYDEQKKKKIQSIDTAKNIENIADRLKVLCSSKDEFGSFYRHTFAHLFAYTAHRIGEIADDIHQIDTAMRNGFGWNLGPFELWDAIGITTGLDWIKSHSLQVPDWVLELAENSSNCFYYKEKGKQHFYHIREKQYKSIPGSDKKIFLSILKKENLVWSNTGASLIDIGKDVVNLEFHTKMNTVGGEILSAIQHSIDIAEKEFRGLVIANEGQNFSAGANLGLVFMMAVEQEYDEIDFAIRAFQNASMRIKYASVPVVLAPHNLSLGGACEFSMHSSKTIVSAETYMGLVEVGVGLIPAGGGTKEFAVRLSEELKEGDIELNQLKNRFLSIAMAKVSTSGLEAFDLGYLRNGIDQMEINRSHQLFHAREAVVTLSGVGYVKPTQKTIKIMGKTGLGMVYAGANSMFAGGYISEFDLKISQKLGFALCGGDLPSGTEVSEQYLLDLEREAFLSLCTEKKTLERIQSILTTGKPLRN